MTAEATQESGRVGALRAKRWLELILREHVDLPFNAYDDPEKLEFSTPGGERFSFDLRGVLSRPDVERFGRRRSVELFVEAKNYGSSGDLLNQYREFVRRALIVSRDVQHAKTCFVFATNVPFGSSIGRGLCSAAFVRECATAVGPEEPAECDALASRLCVAILTDSFGELLAAWCT